MTIRKLRDTLLLGTAILLVIASNSCGSGGSRSKTIVLYAFSSMENVIKEEIIPAFQRSWEKKTGEEVRIITSFAGSGTVTNQIIFGALAQVAMVSTEMDALNIKEAGLVTTDWRSFKNDGTFAYSVTSIITRGGNPEAIYSFEDVTRPGLEVVYPDPTTSSGAQWAILALYGSTLKRGESATGVADRSRASELLKLVSLNAGSLPESARMALTQFGLSYGDVLLTYENEALLDIASGKEYQIVIPESTIYTKPKVVMIDKNIDEGDYDLIRAFIDSLWSQEAQEALARNNFRVWDEEIMATHSDRYQRVALPFTVDYLGG